MTEYKDKILEHEYDGIREMNNSLPRWWLYLFIISIIWAVFYFAYFHLFNIGYLQEDQYRKEMDPNYVRISETDSRLLGILPEYHSPYHNPLGDITPRLLASVSQKAPRFIMTAATDTVTYLAIADPAGIAAGKQAFLKNCAQCHGQLGEGGVGPNLTDDYWIHGADISSLVRSVKYGYPAKGMISWLGTLSEEEIIQTASYIQTLRGTDPPNARSPQGDLVTY